MSSWQSGSISVSYTIDSTFECSNPFNYRREGYVLTRVCPSVCPHPGGGGTPVRSRWGGGTPARSSWGVPPARGYPNGGYPTSGTPSWTWLGVPPTRRYPDGGYPTLGTPLVGPGHGGYPCQEGTPIGGTPPQVLPGWTWPEGYPDGGTSLRVPPVRPGWGGTPMGGGYPTSVVLDTPRSVSLLLSRRRTILFNIIREI